MKCWIFSFKRTPYVLCFILSFFSLLFATIAYSQNTKDGLFFSLERDGKIIHIWGVSHIGLVSHFPISKTILAAFDDSKGFVNESALIFLDNQHIAEILKREYLPKNGRSLSSVLKDGRCESRLNDMSFYKNANSVLKQLNSNLTVEKFEKLSPNAFIHQLYSLGNESSANLIQAMKPSRNVETYLWEIAKEDQKKIAALDPEFWDAIESLDNSELCDFINGLVDVRSKSNFEIESTKALKNLLQSITSNDSLGVQKHYFELGASFNPTFGKVHQKWFEVRNAIMVSKLSKLIESSNDPIFAAIGAAHLGGDEGVIAGLRKIGFAENNSSKVKLSKGKGK